MAWFKLIYIPSVKQHFRTFWEARDMRELHVQHEHLPLLAYVQQYVHCSETETEELASRSSYCDHGGMPFVHAVDGCMYKSHFPSGHSNRTYLLDLQSSSQQSTCCCTCASCFGKGSGQQLAGYRSGSISLYDGA